MTENNHHLREQELRQKLACFHSRLSGQFVLEQKTAPLPPAVERYLTAPHKSPLHPIIEKDLEWMEQRDNHHIISFEDENYPPLLKEVDNPPYILFALGDPAVARFPSFAIVGSRKPSREGIENATGFSAGLTKSGLCITSGLAYGIDAAAHKASIAQGGRTLAVIGTGIDITYPAVHLSLAQEIAKQGLILAIFPRGTKPLRQNFPQRNPIISGISLGVLVVEAGIHSGALITARAAAEQGREVCAIPGSIHSPVAKGCNKLIREGARLVEDCNDILEEIEPLFKSHRQNLPTERRVPSSQLSSEAQQLIGHISHHPIHPDQLVENIDLSAHKIMAALTELEITGLIEQQNGLYRRTSLSTTADEVST